MPLDDATLAEPIPVEQAFSLPKSPALVSVVVPCCGQLEYTRLCVSSLLRHSRRPYELIFVDLDSMDGTTEYLSGLQTAATVPVHILHVSADSGFAGAISSGIAAATGEFIVLLSNDTIVTRNWLEHLLALADSSPAIALVGAMSNSAPAPQSVGSLPYRLPAKTVSPTVPTAENGRLLPDLDLVDRFAQQWEEQNRGKWFETERLATFCLLLKPQIRDLALPLKSQTYFTFDADQMYQKVRQAGFRLACCMDLFIHHFASRPQDRTST